MQAKRITSWEVVDLGVEHPDYFQGFGCSFTDYENCCYGIGNDPQEALNDALESLAQSDNYIRLDDLYLDIIKAFPDFQDDEKNEAASVDIEDQDGAYYHIGIRWNAEPIGEPNNANA